MTDERGMTDDGSSALARVAAAAARDAGGVDPALLKDFLPHVLDAAKGRRRLRRRELDQCRDAGREAAESGVASRAVVDLYLSATWRLWRDHPALAPEEPEVLRESGLAVLRAADDGVASLMEGFQVARADLVRLEESTRHSIVDGLLAGGRAAAEAAYAAAELGLNLSGPSVVLVVEGEARFDGPHWASLPTRMERALQGRLSDSVPLVMLRDGVLLCIVAAPTGAARLDAATQSEGVMAALDVPEGWRVGVSRRRAGAGSVSAGVEEVLAGLRLARDVGLPGRVVDVEELVLYQLLLRDRRAAEDLVESTLGGLREARGGPGALLETLHAYFATGGVATAAARDLHLSVRAVTYRLSRVAELVGRDPADPAERLTLQAAVTVARLMRWPDQLAGLRQHEMDRLS